MQFLIYSLLSILVLFLSYRVSLFKGLIFSIVISIFVAISQIKKIPNETWIFLSFINVLPIIADRFKRNFNRHRLNMRAKLEDAKKRYEDLLHKDKDEIQLNLERDRKLQQVLSLYEISKEMSSFLLFEDIFNILSVSLKRAFRFKILRFVLLKDSKDSIEAVYQIELGQNVNKVFFDDFDRSLVDIAFESEKMVLISPRQSSPVFRRLSIMKDFKTLVSIPFFVEDKISGVLYVEDMPEIQFENFIILTAQFAIQFQKAVLYKRVEELSITDSLTEVSTRRHFLERFSEEIRRSMRHKMNLSFLMLDLDHFKDKNDRFGHLAGDVVLREVARILKSSLREIDIIGRYGGEEFSIVVTGIGKEGIFQVAERIRENIEGAIFKAYDEVLSATISIGVSVFPDDGVDVESLIEYADKALYRAKETGRNRVC